MKYYKLDRNDICFNYEKLTTNKDDFENNHYDDFGDFSVYLCKSEQELLNTIINHFDLEDNPIDPKEMTKDNFFKELFKLTKIVSFEIEHPDKPCIIVKCDPLEDQYDAYKIPKLYLKSAKELETLNLSYPYEVYILNEKTGELTLNKKISTFIN